MLHTLIVGLIIIITIFITMFIILEIKDYRHNYLFRKNDIFSCPYCGESLYKISKHIKCNDVIQSSHFIGIGLVPSLNAGETPTCFYCGESLNFK